MKVGEGLEEGPFLFVVLSQVIYPQDGTHHQGLSSGCNESTVLHLGGRVNDKCLFFVQKSLLEACVSSRRS